MTVIDPADEGLLPCPDCDGTGRVTDNRFASGYAPCPDCDGGGWCHPFMSFAEWAEQVRERHPDATFEKPE